MALSVVKLRQVFPLPVQHVIDGPGHTLFIPQFSLAAFPCPRTKFLWPKPIFPQLSGSIRLEGSADQFGESGLSMCRRHLE